MSEFHKWKIDIHGILASSRKAEETELLNLDSSL